MNVAVENNLETSEKTSLTVKVVLGLLVFQLTSLISLAANRSALLDEKIKPQVIQLLGTKDIGTLQKITTQYIGPLTFYNITYFTQERTRISTSATQIFGFNPRITCISNSQNHLCQ